MKNLFLLIAATFLFKTAICQIDTNKTLSIGDHYGGGIIFSIDPTGQHGLIASPVDELKVTCWGEDGMSGANYMNEGNLNTEKIIAFIKTKPHLFCKLPAACMCDTLTLYGYTDWYLPSINELKEMYDKQKVIGNFMAGDYCSSTANSQNSCWSVHFRPNRKVIFDGRRSNDYLVRCIRKF